MTCNEYVAQYPEKMSEGYWDIRALDVYRKVPGPLVTTTPPRPSWVPPPSATTSKPRLPWFQEPDTTQTIRSTTLGPVQPTSSPAPKHQSFFLQEKWKLLS